MTYKTLDAIHVVQLLISTLLVGLLGTTVSAQQVPANPAPTPAPTPTPKPATASLKIGSLTVSGSLRTRWENTDWYETDKADGNYNFGALLLRLSLGQDKDRYEWLLEGAAPVLLGLPKNAIAPAPQGQLGLGASYYAASGNQDASVVLKQAFIRFKGIFGDKQSSLKLGRFEFNDGTEASPTDAALAAVKNTRIAQRLIGTFGFTHIGRSFDGLHYARNAKLGNFTLVAARPTEGVFQLNSNVQLDVDFYYGAFTKPLKYKSGESEYRLFALHYHDGRRVLKTDNRSAAERTADVDNIRLTTLGGHYIGVRQAGSGKADFLFWGAGQFGNWGKLAQRAAAAAVEAGWQPTGKAAQKLKPWLRGGYFRSTGDGDPADDTHGTFFQVLPTPRGYARFPFFNLMNNEDVFGELILRPHKTLLLRADLHYLRLSSAKDLWYVGGGAFQKRTFGYIGRPANGKREMGGLTDISADWNVTTRTTLTFYLAGSFSGAVQQSIYPLGNQARYGYLELVQKF